MFVMLKYMNSSQSCSSTAGSLEAHDLSQAQVLVRPLRFCSSVQPCLSAGHVTIISALRSVVQIPAST